ncbi:MAG: homoserine O-succinyltransferase [Spirochaetia bacterium]|nr:homoserine O-succinyltransferase [Spirochaetia bacterium]MCI7799210.1 homoserine O-succinyltransferase [Spirochaetia bacterium]
MPIKIPSDLPANEILEKENIFAITEKRALTQDIRPLKIAIVNLMPTKEVTETQILRLLANTPIQIEISLIRIESHLSKNTDTEYLKKFYIPSSELQNKKFDGMIITGAPVEQLEFEDVDYWNELCKIMDYAKKNVFSTLYVCWGAFAGLYHLYGVRKYPLPKKLFGIFMNQTLIKNDPLVRGFDDVFPIPQSRHATFRKEDIRTNKNLVVLAQSTEAGITLVKSKDNREIFMTGHLEYDTGTLASEYFRDIEKGLDIDLPKNYFPNNNPSIMPHSYWRSTAHLFYSNWLNYYVYQQTPFNFTE